MGEFFSLKKPAAANADGTPLKGAGPASGGYTNPNGKLGAAVPQPSGDPGIPTPQPKSVGGLS